MSSLSRHRPGLLIQLSLETKIALVCALLVISALFCLSSGGANIASAARFGIVAKDPAIANGSSSPLRAESGLDVRSLTSRLPLSFEKNVGQLDARARFASRGPGYHLLLTGTGAVLELRKSRLIGPHRSAREPLPREPQNAGGQSRSVITLNLTGANAKAAIHGVDERRERRNFFIGNDPAKWRTDVPTFRAVRYEEIYPGISLTYYGNQQQLEYDFVIAPGADPRTIRMTFGSGVRPQISVEGDLVLHTAGRDVRQRKPVVYQEIDGQRHLVAGGFVLVARQQVGFAVGAYDRTKPLVIDPTLVYSTYLGGSGDDLGNSIAVESLEKPDALNEIVPVKPPTGVAVTA